MAAPNTQPTTGSSPLDGVTISSGEPISLAGPPRSRPQSRDEPSTSPPVELRDLPSSTAADQPQTSHADTTTTNVPSTTAPHPLARKESEAIGPASDQPLSAPDSAAGPTLLITLLLTSGARHPFKIDAKYLAKRGISGAADDSGGGNSGPMNISVYNMKELIWRDWRPEWEPRPTSPSYIRLIFFGAMLDDKAVLKECKFSADSPNVVHMSVKPQELADEDADVKQTKSHGGRRGSEGERRGFTCCVIL